MKIVKLNAINSTNDFLKSLAKDVSVENWTVVTSDDQTKGRGQFKNEWQSEKGKNLTFSVLCRFSDFNVEHSFYLNSIVSLAVYNVLHDFIPNDLHIKWPNDILSASKKICGILIENIVSNKNIVRSIIGIGLNVNQDKFDGLPNATSLNIITGKIIDKELLLIKIVEELKKLTRLIENKSFNQIQDLYYTNLYRMQKPAMYEDVLGGRFMGKITGIDNDGRLVIQLEDNSFKKFGLKEVRFI